MNYSHSIICIFTIFVVCTVPILAKQPYIGKETNDCKIQDESNSAFGYFCNGVNRSCQAYLTFRSEPPFTSVNSISSLLGADPLELSQLNSVPRNATFDTNQIVLVPVTCSCAGKFYQTNTSYVIRQDDTFLTIANNTLEGLSTCQAINAENSEQANNLVVGSRINVPLRCACPTKNQTDAGSNFLLTYLVTFGEFVSLITDKFGANVNATLDGNSLSRDDPTIFPFTSLLVPLENPPLSSQVVGNSPPPPPPPSSPTPPAIPVSDSNKKTWVYVVVGVVGGLVALLILGVVIFFVFFRKKQRKADPIVISESFEAVEKTPDKKVDQESEEFLESLSSIAQSVKVYKLDELKAATENFSPTCLIEGSVYRGVINGDFAAIKKMNGDVSKEVSLLTKINHFNLISLSGICFHDGNWYLVYEYAANGRLSDWKSLNWSQRAQISLDVAMGLNYLHSYTSPPHVHKDLKGSNVLLDGDLRAKIANFGLARSADGQEGEFALTRHIVGTQGYMAPEYLENGFVSTKLDVYAFGVLLLEILTGKEVSALYEGSNSQLAELLVKENLNDFIDPSLQGKYPTELVVVMVRLIDNCIKKDPSQRPSMDEIVQSLSRIMTATHSWEISN